MQRKVLVCQNVTCHQQGSGKVLAAFQLGAPSEVEVEPSGCLGQCGSGPMVLVLPEEVWYCHIYHLDVPVIVEKHLKRGRIVTEKLYPKFHPPKPIWIWLIAFVICLSFMIPIVWALSGQSY
nr:(2Fe-2S) ferredoxin domain-containing protein [Synechococcus sp. PCC 7336]